MATYAAKYTVAFKSTLKDKSMSVLLQKRNYYGANSNKDAPENSPAVLTVTAPNETIESPVRGSSLMLAVYADNDNEYLPLFTSDERMYKLWASLGASVIFYGWLTPELFSQPYMPVEYPVNLTGTDGLGNLKKYEWKQASGRLFRGKQQVWETIVFCLQQIGYELRFLENAYIYETNHSETAADSPLTQTYFDGEVFHKDEDTAEDCYTVLSALLRRFHLIVRHYDQYYHIIQLNNQGTDHVRRRYDTDGSYLSNATWDPEVEVTASSEAIATFNGWIDEWPLLTVLPAWKEIQINQDYGLNDNLLSDYFYWAGSDTGRTGTRGEVTGYTSGQHWDRVYGNGAYIELIRLPNDDASWLESNIGDYVIGDQYLHLKFTLNPVSIGKVKIRLVLIDSSNNEWFADSNGEWQKNTIRNCHTGSLIATNDIELDTFPLPVNGTLYLRLYSVGVVARPSGMSNSYYASKQIRESARLYLNQSEITMRPLEGEFSEKLEFITNINNRNNYIETVDTLLGDLPNDKNAHIIYKGGLYYKSGTEYITTKSWHVKDQPRRRTGSLNAVVSDEMAMNHLKPTLKLEGKFCGDISPLSIINDTGVRYMIIRDEWDMGDNTHQMVIQQISGNFTDDESFLELKNAGYLLLKGGGKIKID